MLEIRGARRSFGSLQAIDDVTFEIPYGTVTGFLGPNGAGKSTTIRILMGLLAPDAGEVRLDGAPLSWGDRGTFGYMPEERGLYRRMRVLDQLVYMARIHGLAKGWAAENARHWLARLGLGDREDAKIGDLSHGNQQRVQLAAALVHDPKVLILDEPFNGLDPLAVDLLAEILIDLAAEGVAVLFSSHQLDLVEDLCASVVMLNRGRVVLAGPVRELRNRAPYRTVTVALADTTTSWSDALAGVEVTSKRDGAVELRVDAGADPMDLLRCAQMAGDVAEFAIQPPRLSELFREAVTA